MADQMVLTTQRWLNSTYGNKTGFGSVQETGSSELSVGDRVLVGGCG